MTPDDVCLNKRRVTVPFIFASIKLREAPGRFSQLTDSCLHHPIFVSFAQQRYRVRSDSFLQRKFFHFVIIMSRLHGISIAEQKQEYAYRTSSLGVCLTYHPTLIL